MVKGFIDTHAHPPTEEYLVTAGGQYITAAAKHFGGSIRPRTFDEMIIEYDAANVEKVVLVAWDAETTTQLPKVSNDFIAKAVDQYPGRLIGFACVDPHKGKAAVKELERAFKDLKLQGAKFHPIAQAFYPNDKQYYPLFEKCLEYDVPVSVHTGTTGWGSGLPGGGQMKLKYANPMYLDEVAADFPELRLIASHPSWPWQNEQLAVAMHKSNVYVEISGWSPKYFEPILVTYMTKLISDRVVFGTDYPFLTPKRWLKDFETLDIRPEVKQKILRNNAVKLLKL